MHADTLPKLSKANIEADTGSLPAKNMATEQENIIDNPFDIENQNPQDPSITQNPYDTLRSESKTPDTVTSAPTPPNIPQDLPPIQHFVPEFAYPMMPIPSNGQEFSYQPLPASYQYQTYQNVIEMNNNPHGTVTRISSQPVLNNVPMSIQSTMNSTGHYPVNRYSMMAPPPPQQFEIHVYNNLPQTKSYDNIFDASSHHPPSIPLLPPVAQLSTDSYQPNLQQPLNSIPQDPIMPTASNTMLNVQETSSESSITMLHLPPLPDLPKTLPPTSSIMVSSSNLSTSSSVSSLATDLLTVPNFPSALDLSPTSNVTTDLHGVSSSSTITLAKNMQITSVTTVPFNITSDSSKPSTSWSTEQNLPESSINTNISSALTSNIRSELSDSTSTSFSLNLPITSTRESGSVFMINSDEERSLPSPESTLPTAVSISSDPVAILPPPPPEFGDNFDFLAPNSPPPLPKAPPPSLEALDDICSNELQEETSSKPELIDAVIATVGKLTKLLDESKIIGEPSPTISSDGNSKMITDSTQNDNIRTSKSESLYELMLPKPYGEKKQVYQKLIKEITVTESSSTLLENYPPVRKSFIETDDTFSSFNFGVTTDTNPKIVTKEMASGYSVEKQLQGGVISKISRREQLSPHRIIRRPPVPPPPVPNTIQARPSLLTKPAAPILKQPLLLPNTRPAPPVLKQPPPVPNIMEAFPVPKEFFLVPNAPRTVSIPYKKPPPPIPTKKPILRSSKSEENLLEESEGTKEIAVKKSRPVSLIFTAKQNLGLGNKDVLGRYGSLDKVI